MPKLTLVIGAAATWKSYYIEKVLEALGRIQIDNSDVEMAEITK